MNVVKREPRLLVQEDKKEEIEDDIESRHSKIRQKFIEEELLKREDSESEVEEESEDIEEEEDEESDEEESDDDDFFNQGQVPRFKPVFVRKEDRTSLINQRKIVENRIKKQEIQDRKAAEDRRKDALKAIETIKREENKKAIEDIESNFESINLAKTDDESEEVAYLNWKVRELKRNKRDKEEREQAIREKEEIEKLRNMTEEDRLEHLKLNPKVVVNQAEKGKYKFMQKYYHRGAFYLDEETDVFKRDITKPTLEDHFDKSRLPKIMQVKNFGKTGRTKYTHLVDQDTTNFESPWSNKNSEQAKIFFQKHGGGMKQVFDRPSKKRKT